MGKMINVNKSLLGTALLVAIWVLHKVVISDSSLFLSGKVTQRSDCNTSSLFSQTEEAYFMLAGQYMHSLDCNKPGPERPFTIHSLRPTIAVYNYINT